MNPYTKPWTRWPPTATGASPAAFTFACCAAPRDAWRRSAWKTSASAATTCCFRSTATRNWRWTNSDCLACASAISNFSRRTPCTGELRRAGPPRARRMSRNPSQYNNRELSWLQFNQRVLDEALDGSVPPLERLKFVAITGSNLDEFFMVRVGGLQLLEERAPGKRDPTGMTPREQLAAISRRVHRMMEDQYRCFLGEIEPSLAAAGIRRLTGDQLDERQQQAVQQAFDREVFAVMTPMGAYPGERFPLLVNQPMALCVQLEPAGATHCPPFAVIPLGRSLDRIVAVPAADGYSYILLEDVLRRHVRRFFTNAAVRDYCVFRVTRNADLSVQEDSAADLLSGMQQVLTERTQSDCVRLE
ncbi:MAG: hypothetical protein FJ276_34735, partial [Planctomycetes bacterium]|nr:hypothetical protein [Planctomycetota bacterium]